MVMIIGKNVLLLCIGYYLMIVVLPVMLNIDPLMAKYMFLPPVCFWLLTSKNKWWIDGISVGLAILISFPILNILLNNTSI